MPRIIVTGAAGFIGGNLIRALNERGHEDIVAVDDMTEGDKFRNLAGCAIADYWDRDELRTDIRRWNLRNDIGLVFHQGACADTTESDGRYMMDVNYTYSKEILNWCLERRIPLVYASSASVYGLNTDCSEQPHCENPLNVYAYSKLQFDNYVRRILPEARSTVVGLRYFNVYGPHETHKGRMASMVWQLWQQLNDTGIARLFEGTDGHAHGDQQRDFVAVADVAAVNLFFGFGPVHTGIYNVGTGQARSFNEVAKALIQHLGRGHIEYIPFPTSLVGKYQSFTQADLSRLRAAGYEHSFATIEQGIDSMIAGDMHQHAATPPLRAAG